MWQRKNLKTYRGALLTWFAIAAIIFLFAPQSLTSKLQFAFVRIFYKPISLCRNFTQKTNKQQSAVVEQSRYLMLRNHLANTINLLQQERANVEKLSGLRNRFVWEGVNFVLADVITSFDDISCNEFIINRGSDDGLSQGQFVFNDQSIIGIIADIDSRIARVQRLTDTKCKVAVKIGQIDFKFMMQGNGDGSAGIQLVPKKYDIKKGDIVYVQKKPGFLDFPIIAGTVAQCETDYDNPLLWKVKVVPVYEMKDIESVTVIVIDSQKCNKNENDKTAT
jgi:rod shape-determining protein MreC